MSSCLRRYSVRHELNTLDACWIAVDVWSNSSRCRKYRSTCLGRDAYMYDHCLRYCHDFSRIYQLLDSNLFTHRNTYAILREATSETYGPRVYFPLYKFPISYILQSLLSNLYHKNTKNIYLIISMRSHFCKWS